jgi:hypothetical protein
MIAQHMVLVAFEAIPYLHERPGFFGGWQKSPPWMMKSKLRWPALSIKADSLLSASTQYPWCTSVIHPIWSAFFLSEEYGTKA